MTILPSHIDGCSTGEFYRILHNNVHGSLATVLRLVNTYSPRMRVEDARQTLDPTSSLRRDPDAREHSALSDQAS
jgi:hypothetical protein